MAKDIRNFKTRNHIKPFFNNNNEIVLKYSCHSTISLASLTYTPIAPTINLYGNLQKISIFNLHFFNTFAFKFQNSLHDYFESETFNGFSYMTTTNPSQNSPQNPSQTIFHSSFRDKFISEYHIKVAEEKLTSVSDNTSREITKTFYDFLYNLCNVKYNLYIFCETDKGFEGFIDNHTYITCSWELKTNKYYFNTFFSYDPSTIDIITNQIQFVPKTATVSWVTGVHSDGSLDIEQLPIEVPKPIYNSFYPWLGDVSLEDFLDNYISSDEAILLLYGVPGTGKSNLLKYLLHKYNANALITYQDDIRDLDKMFSSFLKSDSKFLIIEDADEFLTKRESGNTSMKRLLNIADGLTSNTNKKVIFTTNLTNLNSIDSALLRDGRCFAAIKFDKLNQEEALNVAIDLNIDTTEITKSNYTLAEMFSILNKKQKLIKSQQVSSFGFS